MSRTAKVRIVWADGEHTFRLGIRELQELDEKTKAGPQELYNRFRSQTWRVNDLRETIRIGLIGGGMAPADALARVMRYVDERPLQENIEPAFLILQACIVGVPEEPVGEAEGVTESPTDAPHSPTGDSASATSMESAAQPA